MERESFYKSTNWDWKDFFIFNKLLDHAIQEKRKILYLVNRRILKKQLDEVLKEKNRSFQVENRDNRSVDDFIEIMTYQSVEVQLLENTDFIKYGQYLDSFFYVVYDECHYFYNDANFNTNTALSFEFLTTWFKNKVQIFMSATIECIENFIINTPYIDRRDRDEPFLIYEPKEIPPVNMSEEYNVIFTPIENLESLKPDIAHSLSGQDDEKWLIFVDNIEMGKKLKSTVLNFFGKEDISNIENKIVFVDARYEEDDIANGVVEEISQKEKSEKQVIIATAVLDNGVTIHDVQVKNVVIMADTKVSFIQMLGRRRMDSNSKDEMLEGINLFVCKRDVKHFENRKNSMKELLDYYEAQFKNYNQKAFEVIVPTAQPWSNYMVSNQPQPIDIYNNGGHLQSINLLSNAKQENNTNTLGGVHLTELKPVDYYFNYEKPSLKKYLLPFQCAFITPESVSSRYIFDYIQNEQVSVFINQPFIQDKIIRELLKSTQKNRYAKRFLYCMRGYIAVNNIAIQRCYDLYSFYSEMVEKMNDDPDAFLKVQAEWLHLDTEDMQKKLGEADKRFFDSHVNAISDEITNFLEKEYRYYKAKLDKEHKELREKTWKHIRYALKYKLKICEIQPDEKEKISEEIDNIGKSDRFTDKRFNTIMQILSLPYKMVVTKAGADKGTDTFIIKQVEQKEAAE